MMVPLGKPEHRQRKTCANNMHILYQVYAYFFNAYPPHPSFTRSLQTHTWYDLRQKKTLDLSQLNSIFFSSYPAPNRTPGVTFVLEVQSPVRVA